MEIGHSDNSPGARRLVVAGGGTGGHLFPAVAVVQEFLARHPDNRVLFVVSGKPFEIDTLTRLGFDYEILAAEGLKGRGKWRQLITLFKIPVWTLNARRILKSFAPDQVLGVGSYTAGPVVLAAWLMGTGIALQEQNILPGITNRALAPLAKRIYVSFEETAGAFQGAKVLVSGNPVRDEILLAARQAVPPKTAREDFTVLVLGGSQGAHAVNQAVIDALAGLGGTDRFRFVHQTGAADEQIVREAYRHHGVAAEAAAFFADMGPRYVQADLVICRAGATTVAELCAVGKGSILIPFPYAADDHQRLNALTLVDRGAGEMILEKDLDGSNLAKRIVYYADNPAALSAMADNARGLGRPDAAAAIVEDIFMTLEANDAHRA
jgi:UDP-N-acetylglucosamine--N-acetylmuramyl-(pentapeptide) pyrophosphoryl-undecaprenol N-acetylglucosamine transferase